MRELETGISKCRLPRLFVSHKFNWLNLGSISASSIDIHGRFIFISKRQVRL